MQRPGGGEGVGRKGWGAERAGLRLVGGKGHREKGLGRGSRLAWWGAGEGVAMPHEFKGAKSQ